jgi:hypothetical protein
VNQLTNTLNADQRRTIENVRQAATRIWERPLHRTYTDHSVAHSERVITLLDGLTAGMMSGDKRLSPGEIFILLAAAYLHDVGMQNEKFAGGDVQKIRERHNEQTAEMIYAVFEDPDNAFPIPLARDPGLVEAVALVAQGHRRVDLNAPGYDPLVHGGETLRLRLLAALLRFGDELDIDHRRVDLDQMKLLDLSLDSQLHWYKCYYVSGVSIVDEYIRVSYRFPRARPDYEDFIVPLVEGEIRAKHAALEPIFRAHAVKVALGPSQVRLMRPVQPLPPEVEGEMGKSASRRVGESASRRVSEPAGQRGAEPADRRAGELDTRLSTPPAPTRGDETGAAATLAGSGAIAQGRSAAATTGGVAVGGDVGGDVVTGTKVTGVDAREQTIGTQIHVSGDYYAERQAPAAPARDASDGPGWNRAAIGDLLNAAFSDGELDDLCFYHFEPVHQNFSAGMDKRTRIRALLDYCFRQGQVENLLALIREHNAFQYTRFQERLKG